jgi:hypothetical protein
MPVAILKFAVRYVQLIFKCQKSLELSGRYKMENGRDSDGAYDKDLLFLHRHAATQIQSIYAQQ